MDEKTPKNDSAGRTLDPLAVIRDHSRRWQANRYVYPVVSRRSRGLSIGVNLNPDTACNFDCVYCQVDRNAPDRGARVELEVLCRELDEMLAAATSGELFDAPKFATVPPEMRTIRDIAFSGDGEPTTCPQFPESVRLVADLKRRYGLSNTRIVLITDAAYLNRPEVGDALEMMDKNRGEIWAKLDAGTEAYFQRINRPNVSLAVILENILQAARKRPVVIQSMWMRLDGRPPPSSEIEAFMGRLNQLKADGGRISLVQVYTVARVPAEAFVTPLSDAQVDEITVAVRAGTGLPAEPFYTAIQ